MEISQQDAYETALKIIGGLTVEQHYIRGALAQAQQDGVGDDDHDQAKEQSS